MVSFSIVGWIAGYILEALNAWYWILFIQGPLHIINSITKVLEYLSGGAVFRTLLGDNNNFSWSNLPAIFLILVVTAICIFVLMFVIQFIVIYFKDSIEGKKRFIKILKNGARATTFIVLIPIFFFIANYIMQNFVALLFNQTSNETSLADFLYYIGDTDWDGNFNRKAPSSFDVPSRIEHYNFILEIVAVWFMLLITVIIGLILVQKSFELFFLFIISPLVMVAMIIDDGRAAIKWKDMVISKFLASCFCLLSFYIFITLLQTFFNKGFSSLSDPIERQTLIVLVMFGSGVSILQLSSISSKLIGEKIGVKESFHTFTGAVTSMALLAASVGRPGVIPAKIPTIKAKSQNKNNSKLENDERT